MVLKHKLKELMLSDISDVTDDLVSNEAISSDAQLSMEPPLTVDSPSMYDPNVDFRMDEKLSTLQTSLFTQFSSMFADFSKQLKGKFSKTDDQFDKLGSSQFSFDLLSQGNINVIQDVSNISFQLPPL